MIIRKGATGVGAIVQQPLVEAGYQIPQAELDAATFGDGTYDAVRAFQASHLGPDGAPLVEDGVVGELTMWALQHPGGGIVGTVDGWRCDLSLVRSPVHRVVELAIGEMGIHEVPDGSNRGPRVDVYTGPDFLGSPWCALFVSWCFAHGMDDGSPFGRIASVNRLYAWAQSAGRVLGELEAPQPGDVFAIIRDELHGHCGLVVGQGLDGRMATCEGNSSNMVRGLLRTRQSVAAVLRPVPL